MTIKTIFLDRDGVINKDTNYLYKIDDFEFINGIFETCQYFINMDYKIIIVTNQSGIARGYYSENDYQKITLWMLSQFKLNGVNILDVYHCPHSYDSKCNCRKPKPGMLINAKNKYNLEFDKSWMIGDSETDIKAANSAGITNTILIKSDAREEEKDTNASFLIGSIEDAKNIILR